MDILSIDLETFSSVDITTAGAYKYVESDDFEIMLLAYALNDEPVTLLDFTNKNVLFMDYLNRFTTALLDSKVLKVAFNANFERLCLSKHYNSKLPVEQWQCTSV